MPTRPSALETAKAAGSHSALEARRTTSSGALTGVEKVTPPASLVLNQLNQTKSKGEEGPQAVMEALKRQAIHACGRDPVPNDTASCGRKGRKPDL
eukprot:2557455-Amphidinium_carterae.2